MSVLDVLAASPAPGGAPALVGPDGVLDYADLSRRVDRRCAVLREGDPLRDVVALSVEADVSGIVELLALWRSGLVPAALHPGLTTAEREVARQELRGATVPTGTQAVLWTSGTAGRPRGVALSAANLEASVHAAASRLRLGADDVWAATLSPAHVGGLVLVVRSILLGGALVTVGRFDAERLSDLLDGTAVGSHRPSGPTNLVPTHLSLVPTQLLRLLEHRGDRPAPDTVRCVLLGGAHAPAALVARARALGWPLALTYGATEMTSQIATAPPELTARKPGTVGAPLEGVEVRLDDTGELHVRGATRALGYLGDDVGPLGDAEGWYATGDLARVDADGHLWITGRRVDRIVSGGVTVDAVEVEEAIRTHPTVLDVCVVGLPDEEWGEVVGAWVEPVVGEFALEEVERALRETLSAAKRPRVWRIGDALPRNANGKVDRTLVRRTLGAGRRRGSERSE